MSDKDFIIIDELENEKKDEYDVDVADEKKGHSVVTQEKADKDDDGYEKYCLICHRPESVAGKMIDLPNNITVCSDCMQKSFDAMTNGSIDYTKLFNTPGIQFMNMSDLENMTPKSQKIKKKSGGKL